MKVVTWKVFLCITMMVGMFSLVSCGDEDENDSDARSSLIGTWVLVHSEGYEVEDGEKSYWDEDVLGEEDADPMVFNENGKGTIVSDEGVTIHCEWSVKNGYLIQTATIEEEKETISSKIVLLENDTLVLENFEKGDETDPEGYEFYEKLTYKRR